MGNIWTSEELKNDNYKLLQDACKKNNIEDLDANIGKCNGDESFKKEFIAALKAIVSNDDNALALACTKGSGLVASRILTFAKDNKFLDELLANNNHGALHNACVFGHLGIANNLLDSFYTKENINVALEIGDHQCLRNACRHGKLDVVKKLFEVYVQNGIDILQALKGVDDHNWPLRNACANGRLDVVKFLIENGYKEDNKMQGLQAGEHSALLLACENGHEEVVTYLLNNAYKTNENIKAALVIQNHQCLRNACKNGKLGVVKKLFEVYEQNNIDILQALNGENGNTWNWPLRNACANGHAEVVQYLFEQGYKNPENIKKGLQAGNHHALTIASKNKHANVVKVLIVHGYKEDIFLAMNSFDNDTQKYLKDSLVLENHQYLCAACGSGKIEFVKKLFEFNAQNNIDILHALKGANDHNLPLRNACANGRLDVVKFLIENGYKEDNKMQGLQAREHSALLLACENGHEEVVTYLLNNAYITKENINAALVIQNHQCLRNACRNGKLGVVKKLFEVYEQNNIDILQALYGEDGNTWNWPLRNACANGHAEVVQYLFDQGYKNPDNIELGLQAGNHDALTIASKNGHKNVVNLLIDHGYKKNNYSATRHAVAEGNYYVVSLLANDEKVPADLKADISAMAKLAQDSESLDAKLNKIITGYLLHTGKRYKAIDWLLRFRFKGHRDAQILQLKNLQDKPAAIPDSNFSPDQKMKVILEIYKTLQNEHGKGLTKGHLHKSKLETLIETEFPLINTENGMQALKNKYGVSDKTKLDVDHAERLAPLKKLKGK